MFKTTISVAIALTFLGCNQPELSTKIESQLSKIDDQDIEKAKDTVKGLLEEKYKLTINSDPADADIRVDGKAYKKGEYPEGKHKIAVSKVNFHPQEMEIDLKKKRTIDVKLEPSHFSLYFSVENVYPEGIDIDVEGVENFENGMFLKTGVYRYRVSKWGFQSITGSVELNQNRRVSLLLPKATKL